MIASSVTKHLFGGRCDHNFLNAAAAMEGARPSAWVPAPQVPVRTPRTAQSRQAKPFSQWLTGEKACRELPQKSFHPKF
jgi:hypothetical protein